MRILITGSRGFVGSSVARFAARAGHDVLGITRSEQPAPDWPGRHTTADVAHTDLTPLLREFAPDAIVHAAGAASVGASFTQPLDDLRAAVLTWANVLDGVRRSGQRPVVLFPSSAAVYGNPATLPVSEDASVTPISPYGFHKAACELLAREYAACFGLDIRVCRLFSVYGPAQRRLLVWEIYRQLAAPGEDTVWLGGTGRETRDYVFVEDVAAAFLRLIAGTRQSGDNSPVNVASGQEVSVLDLARRLRDLVAPHKQIACRGEERPGDPLRWRAETGRLCARLGNWQPRTLEQGLRECVASWTQPESIRDGR